MHVRTRVEESAEVATFPQTYSYIQQDVPRRKEGTLSLTIDAHTHTIQITFSRAIEYRRLAVRSGRCLVSAVAHQASRRVLSTSDRRHLGLTRPLCQCRTTPHTHTHTPTHITPQSLRTRRSRSSGAQQRAPCSTHKHEA